MAARMSLRAAGSSWRKASRARGRASTAYSLLLVPEFGFEFVGGSASSAARRASITEPGIGLPGRISAARSAKGAAVRD